MRHHTPHASTKSRAGAFGVMLFGVIVFAAGVAFGAVAWATPSPQIAESAVPSAMTRSAKVVLPPPGKVLTSEGRLVKITKRCHTFRYVEITSDLPKNVDRTDGEWFCAE